MPQGCCCQVALLNIELGHMCILSLTHFLCRYLVEAPPNICTPTHLADAAAKIAEGASDVMQLEILEKEDCEKLSMGCYLAVAACSAEPPKFIHLTYRPKGEVTHYAQYSN